VKGNRDAESFRSYAAHVEIARTKGERTKQAIIEAAAPLFNQLGYAGCSMADIMEATGVEKGCIYRHFANKEELAAEVFRYAAAKSFEVRGLDRVDEGDAISALRRMTERFVSSPSAVPGGCPLLNFAVDADDGNPILRKLVHEALEEWKGRVRRIVTRGLEAGDIVTGTDPRSAANIVVSILEGATMLARLERSKRPLEDASAALHQLFELWKA
jgi:TetR/AcrR family transcriptional repressor of nem operon